LAEQILQFDARVGEVGLQAAGRALLLRYVSHLDIVGAENIPTTGGVLFATNHPGMTDTLAFFSGVGRPDVQMVSNDRPFLRALPNISQKLIYVSDQPSERFGVVRQVARALQKGGGVYICPAGEIEPDPGVMPGALESLDTWSESLGMFVRLAPNSVIVPTVISNVIYAPSLVHPLTRLRRQQKDRERIAATIQAFLHSTGSIRSQMKVRIEFGPPLPASELIPFQDPKKIMRAITDAVMPLLVKYKSDHARFS
jgi:1-acyl-sn-glycerol-3-phosphate acyltransferase